MTTVSFTRQLDVYIDAEDSSYSDALNGLASQFLVQDDVGGMQIGQVLGGSTYRLKTVLLGFDTSSIPDNATIQSATLKLTFFTDQSGVDFNIECAAYDYGASVTTADWRTQAQLAALTVLARRSTSGLPIDTPVSFSTVGAGLASVINKTGTTKLYIYSSRQAAASAPSAAEYVGPYDHALAVNIFGQPTWAPTLEVTYTTETTVTSNVTTSASINALSDKDVTTSASIGIMADEDVTTDASLTAPITTNVETAAALNLQVAGDVTSGAAISTTATGDVTTDAALARTESAEVTSEAAVLVEGTFQDVFTTASVSTIARESIVSDAAIAFSGASDVSTTAAIEGRAYPPDHSLAMAMPRGSGRDTGLVPKGSARMQGNQKGAGR